MVVLMELLVSLKAGYLVDEKADCLADLSADESVETMAA